MNLFDLPIEELRKYKPENTSKEDFNEFWDSRIVEAEEQPLNISKVERKNYYVKNVKVYDVEFDGFRNSRVHCTYVTPLEVKNGTAGVVMYHGYNWNSHEVNHAFKYTIQGIPVLLVEVRGQTIKSPDHNKYINGGSAGWMVKGILDKDNYYYSNVYMDCYRAVNTLLGLDNIDGNKVIIEGVSQGGGLTIATAALHPKVAVALSDIPYLCHFERAVKVCNGSPYEEIYHYFKLEDPLHETEEKVYETLSYIDGMNLAKRIKCPILMSVGLEDNVCPPSTGFAVFNHLDCKKEIRVYPEYAHGGFARQDEEKLKFVNKYME